jgi:hypothetical protein
MHSMDLTQQIQKMMTFSLSKSYTFNRYINELSLKKRYNF